MAFPGSHLNVLQSFYTYFHRHGTTDLNVGSLIAKMLNSGWEEKGWVKNTETSLWSTHEMIRGANKGEGSDGGWLTSDTNRQRSQRGRTIKNRGENPQENDNAQKKKRRDRANEWDGRREDWYWSVALSVMRLPASSPPIGQLPNSEHAFPQSLNTTSNRPHWFTTLWVKTAPAGNGQHINKFITLLNSNIYTAAVCFAQG